jgi:hypothetical protein
MGIERVPTGKLIGFIGHPKSMRVPRERVICVDMLLLLQWLETDHLHCSCYTGWRPTTCIAPVSVVRN